MDGAGVKKFDDSYRPPPSATLFVADLNAEVTSDQIRSGFECCNGYLSHRMTSDKSKARVAFVEFDSVVSAVQAREALNGIMRLRPQDPPVSIHFARPSYGDATSGKASQPSGKRERSQREEDSGRSIRAREGEYVGGGGPVMYGAAALQSAPPPAYGYVVREGVMAGGGGEQQLYAIGGNGAPLGFNQPSIMHHHHQVPPSQAQGYPAAAMPYSAHPATIPGSFMPQLSFGGGYRPSGPGGGPPPGPGGYGPPSQQPLPPSGGNPPSRSLYVEFLPPGTSEREAAHIFRPFTGFLECRFIPISKKSGTDAKTHNLFVDFETAQQAHVALSTLQGYAVDLKDPKAGKLSLEFAKTMHRRERQ